MKRISRASCVAFACLALVACAGAKTIETGPKVKAELNCGFAHVRSDDPTAATDPRECEVDSEKKVYVLSISVDADNGDKHDEKQETKAEDVAAKPPTVTITVDGQPIPTPPLTPRDYFQGKTYESQEFTIPDTSKGKTVTLHAETTDDHGLKSNAIDLKVILK